jgi:hypothetical protein
VIGRADGTVKTGVDGIIYVRNFLNGQVLTVYNFVAPNRWNLQVEIGRKVEQPGLWQVKGVREAYAVPAGGSASAGTHTHDELFLGWDRFLPFLVYPIAGGGFTVQVIGIIFPKADNSFSFVDNQTLDLSAYVPVTGAKYVLIEADDDGEIHVIEGNTVTSPGLLTVADIPPITIGRRASCAVRLYVGQTQLYRDPFTINDFEDVRFSRSQNLKYQQFVWIEKTLGETQGVHFQLTGALTTATNIFGAWVAPFDGEFQSLIAYVETPGTANVTIVDAHLNGTTIYIDQDDRPTIPYDDADGKSETAPAVTTFSKGDLVTVDLDAIADDSDSISCTLIVKPAIDPSIEFVTDDDGEIIVTLEELEA